MTSSPIQVALVDDETLARDVLRRFVDRHPQLEIIWETTSSNGCMEKAHQQRPDLIFLDIEMPGEDGFEAFARIVREIDPVPQVVFVTAYDKYAVRAFEAQALDYLMKPVSEDRFHQAVDRFLKTAMGSADTVDQPSPDLLKQDALKAPPERLLVKQRGKIVPLLVEEIDWIEANGDYVNIHRAGVRHLIEKTLTEMEALLAPQGFLRIHRSALVNRDRISHLESLGSGRYRMTLRNIEKTQLTVSRSYSAQFRGDLL